MESIGSIGHEKIPMETEPLLSTKLYQDIDAIAAFLNNIVDFVVLAIYCNLCLGNRTDMYRVSIEF